MIATLENKTTLSLLHLALRLDALVTGANGLAYLVAAPLLDDVLGTDAGFLRAIGAFLLVYGIGVWILGSQERPNTLGVELTIAANTLWAIASIGFASTRSEDLTAIGIVWIVLQAGVVGLFAVLQVLGVRRSKQNR